MLLHIFLNTIIFLSTLGLLIIVHECGHFLSARFLTVKVERFSIGFGPVLWSKKDSHNTKYTIAIILLGGYVKLCNQSFFDKKIWERSLIVISGPIFNFIFSILIYTMLYIIGMPTFKPTINYIFPDSIIAQSDISIGSQIKFINNIQVDDWESVRLQILNNINKEKIAIFTELTKNGNKILQKNDVCLMNLINQSIFHSTDPIIALGMLPNVLNVRSTLLNEDLYCFDLQGVLKINDKILLINNQPIYDQKSFMQIIKNNSNKIFNLVIERDKCILHLNCKLIEKFPFNSKYIQRNIDLFCKTVTVESTPNVELYRYNLYDAILKSFKKFWNYTCFIIYTLVKLIGGDIKITNLHGPVAIAKIASQTIQYGIVYYCMFLSMISINLGIINLLPFPILDGGQLLFLLIEKIRGHTVSLQVQHFANTVSFIILIIIMFMTLYNDIIS